VDASSKPIPVKLSGTLSKDASLWLAGLGGTDGLFAAAASGAAYDLHSPGQRGAGEALLDADIPADALVELEFDNGMRFWTLGEHLRERLQDPQQRSARGLADDDGPWTLPTRFELPGERRGIVGKLALKALRWVGFDPVKFGRDKLVELAETRSVPREGLFLVGDDGITGAPLTAPIPDGGPTLILLHGTASCTRGSFSKLWLRQREQWALLRKHFGPRIYALEHHTLTASPIANALQLARLLPTSGGVSFMSHSRGGLVGELLCLDPQGIDEAGAIARLDAGKIRDKADAAAIDRQIGDFRALLGELRRRPQLQIERFARVACPVLGTSLAGDKLDKWGSLLVLAAIADEMRHSSKRGIVGEVAESVLSLGLDAIGETIAGILASRRKASELPGLLAMMPGSAVVALINASPGRGELYVLAGDAQPREGDWLADLRFWLTDRYYERDHDLVVDTRAMLDGPQRPPRPDGTRCKVQFRSGSDVNHFSYFGNADSARAAVAALTRAPGADSLFRDYLGQWPLGEPGAEAARGLFGPRPAADPAIKDARGVVVIVPGLCGSELKVGARGIWASLLALAGGGLRDDLYIGNPNVQPGQPLADSYLGLANALRQRGYVALMHGYDWRKPLAGSTAALAATLNQALDLAKGSGKPVHAIVHSMGGVLIRATLAGDNALWQRWNGQPGDPRIVMLGTPNKGSHAITLLLTGRDKFFGMLSLLDICHSQEKLLDTVKAFPGVLELLPIDPAENGAVIRQAATWKTYIDLDKGPDWPRPGAAELAASGAIWDTLARNDPLIASERLIYVAGIAPQTPVRASTDGGRFELLCTNRGDGRVPWSSGIPAACTAGARVYYVDAVHGDLPKARDAYDGYVDLLEKGKTDKLASRPPVARGAAEELQPFDDTEVRAALFPNEGDLVAAATGGTLFAARKSRKESAQARVRVLHGDLLYAESAVLVGHTWGSNALESAEKLLDQALGGRMQKILDAGLHAGPLGTYSLYRKHPGERFTQGAIVIGMGRIGQLSGGQLAQAVSKAVAAYAVQELEAAQQTNPADRQDVLSLGVTALLIGAGVGELTLPDSVAAIMRGHRDARERLERGQLGQRIRLDRLDFIEVLEDRAINALRAARDVVEVDREMARAFLVDTAIRPHTGGRRRAAPAADEGQWQRIAISAIGGGSDGSPRLMFDVYGELARAERTYNTVPFKDIERFTRSLIGTTADQEQVGHALFELLVPNWLKDLAPDRRRTQLVLDKTAAAYPWELLRDRATVDQHDSGQPLSVRGGLIRQLATGDFRLNVTRATGFRALVVGNPQLGEWGRFLPSLQGAVAEAEAVADLFDDAQFEPCRHIEDNAQDILLDLFSGEWRILHLSGHGLYEQALPATDHIPARSGLTGMVIGGGDLLMPAHISQMRAVPDFVFINCCNLGRIEDRRRTDDGDSAAPRPGNPALAANLATELIEIGVRCVIAAGWEVLDDAAQLFAETFYGRFLSGECFGEAVLAARVATFEQYGRSNTWGAYQCYGDPSFVLACAPGATRRPAFKAPEYDCLSASEVLDELQRLSLRADHARDLGKDAASSPERHAAPLLALCERQGWIRQGDILEAFGTLFSEHACHEEAIDYYRRALAAPDGSASRKAEEQLASMLTRRAQLLADAGELDAAVERLDEATAILAVDVPRRSASSERLNLQAAVDKRRLLCHIRAGDTGALLPTLEGMVGLYFRALERAGEEGGDLRYPALNAAHAASLVLLAGGTLPDEVRQGIREKLRHFRDRESATPPKDFWGLAARADLLLAEGLFALASTGQGSRKLDDAKKAYRELLVSRGSPRERESVLSTLDVLQQVAGALPSATDKAGERERAIKALGEIHDGTSR